MAAASLFDQRQARFWEADHSYADPRNPTAVASAQPKIEALQQALNLPRTTTVLDVGAGNGVFSWQLARHFDAVTCMDAAWNMISRNAAGRCLQASAYTLPFADGAFDLVFCGNLLHHVAEPELAVKEMARVARRHLALCEPNRWNPPLLAYMALAPEERGGVKFTPAYLRGLAKRAGLDVMSCRPMGLVYERSTPAFLLPLLKPFDRPFWFGAYSLLIGAKGA